MKKFLKETRYVGLFLVVLTIFTVFTYVDSETAVAVSPLDQIKRDILTASPKVIRAPANVDVKSSTALARDFFCGKEILGESVNQKLVMINFKVCESEKQYSELSFVNSSNGFRAQIFKLGDSNFKTDYIQLTPGSNKLNIEIILKDGQKRMESLEIVSGS